MPCRYISFLTCLYFFISAYSVFLLMIQAYNVSYTYPGQKTHVLRDITFNIPIGSRVLVVGENGAGKSTLLRMLNGDHKSSTGYLKVCGKDAFEGENLRSQVKFISSDLPGFLSHLRKSNTVQSIARSVLMSLLNEELLHKLVRDFNMDLESPLDTLSDGEMRKLHMLMILLQDFDVLLIDECTRDVDIIARRAFIEYLQEASHFKLSKPSRKTVLYATHIMDDMDSWPTHILLLKDGKVNVQEAGGKGLRNLVSGEFYGISQELLQNVCHLFDGELQQNTSLGPCALCESSEVSHLDIHIENFDIKSFFRAYHINTYPKNEAEVLPSCTVTVPEGSRVLLFGPNGSGKSFLLQLLSGERFYSLENRMGLRLSIGGRVCFHDTKLVGDVAYGGHWWSDEEPEWDLTVKEMLDCRHPTWQSCHYTSFVAELFMIDMTWRVRSISTGQRKRVQLLLRLVPFREVIFLDEATSDLDMPTRIKFLAFLQHLSRKRRVSIIYCSHIYEDLMWWGDHALFLRVNRTFRDALWERYSDSFTKSSFPNNDETFSILVKKNEKYYA